MQPTTYRPITHRNRGQRMSAKQRANLMDLRIERAYREACSGIQIDLMDIPKVFAEGRRLIINEGVDNEGLCAGLKKFVQSIAYK